MRRRSRVAVSVLYSALLFTTGCGPQGLLSRDPAVATRQVAELIPRGTSEVRARKKLVDRGFTLSRLSSDHATNHLIIATYTGGDRMWQVGLLVVDARVAATTVTVTDLGASSRWVPWKSHRIQGPGTNRVVHSSCWTPCWRGVSRARPGAWCGASLAEAPPPGEKGRQYLLRTACV